MQGTAQLMPSSLAARGHQTFEDPHAKRRVGGAFGMPLETEVEPVRRVCNAFNHAIWCGCYHRQCARVDQRLMVVTGDIPLKP